MNENEERKRIEERLKNMQKDYLRNIQNDVFEGKDEQEDFQGSNDNMEKVIEIYKNLEDKSMVTIYCEDAKKAFGPMHKHDKKCLEEIVQNDENFQNSSIKRSDFITLQMVEKMRNEDPKYKDVTIKDLIGNIRTNQVADETYLDMSRYNVDQDIMFDGQKSSPTRQNTKNVKKLASKDSMRESMHTSGRNSFSR